MSGSGTPSQGRLKHVLRALTPNAGSKQQTAGASSTTSSPAVPPSPAGSDFEDEDLQPPQFVSSFMKDFDVDQQQKQQQQQQLKKSNSWLSTNSTIEPALAPSADSKSNMGASHASRPNHRPRHSEDNLASPTAQTSGRKVFGSSTWNRSKDALVGGLKRANSSSSVLNDFATQDKRASQASLSSEKPAGPLELDSHKSPAPVKTALNPDSTAHNSLSSQAAYHAKSTPGGPIHLGAGLSESSKRFRSAFRMRPRGEGMSTLRKPSRALVTEQPGAELDSESSPGSSHHASPQERDGSYNASARATSASPEDQALARSMERVQLAAAAANDENARPDSAPASSNSKDPLRSTYAAGRLQHRLEAASLVPASSSSSRPPPAAAAATEASPLSRAATPPRQALHIPPELAESERTEQSPSSVAHAAGRGEKRKSPHTSTSPSAALGDKPTEPRLQVLRAKPSPPRVARMPPTGSGEHLQDQENQPTPAPESDFKMYRDHDQQRATNSEPRQIYTSSDQPSKPSLAERPGAQGLREAALDPENRVAPRPLRDAGPKSALGAKAQPQQQLPLSSASLGVPRAPLGDVPSFRQKHASNGAPPDRVVPLKAGSLSPPEARDVGLGRPPPQLGSGLPSAAPSSSSARAAGLQPPALSAAPPQSSTSAASGSIRKATHVVVNGKQYLRSALLGKGGSSRVYRITDREHNVFALKKVELGRGDLETYTSFCNEIELLKRLRGHDRIIQLVDSEVNEAKRTLIMILEIGEIDLNSLLQERIGKRVSMNFIRQTWEQMLEAVKVVHDAGIVHTDLKPANFVLVKGALKLIDFGIAKAIPSDTTNIARDQQIGTANYMSPEALCDSGLGDRGERLMKMGRPSDVWSLGCILYQMVYGVTPFGHMRNLPQKMIAIQNPLHQIPFPTQAVPKSRDGHEQPELAVRIEADLLRVLRSCLRFESKSRSTIPQLLADSFLRREDSIPVKDGDVVPLSLEMVSGIVARSVQWSAGRMPSRDEQQQFVDDLFAQLSAGMERV